MISDAVSLLLQRLSYIVGGHERTVTDGEVGLGS